MSASASASASMLVRYLGEGSGAVGAVGAAGCCTVHVVQDPAAMRRLLTSVGADSERDVGVKLLVGKKGRRRQTMCVLWFDGERPAVSAAMAAMAVAALVHSDGECVRLRLDKVDARHRERLLLTTAKTCYVPIGSQQKQQPSQQQQQQQPRRPLLEFGGVGSHRRGEELERLASAMVQAADLENHPSNLVGPEAMAELVGAWFAPEKQKQRPVMVRVMHAAELERLGLGLVVGVGRSGERPPCMVELTLRSTKPPPAGSGGKGRRPVVVLVGKGVTYDAGGLAVKPLYAMLGMHGDKSGAAVAAAVLRYYADADAPALPFDLVALLPSVENVVSSRAVHPGDVLTACNGLTVEVVNPDAEGRLILADAMAYAGKAHAPVAIVDFATLTEFGSLLAPDTAAVYYTADDALAATMQAAGEATGERCWRLPPWEEYGIAVSSLAADVRNAGWATNADAFMAAMFLRRFVPASCGPRWLHVDISTNTASAPAVSGGGRAAERRGGSGGGSGDPFVGTGVALGVHAVAALAKPRRT